MKFIVRLVVFTIIAMIAYEAIRNLSNAEPPTRPAATNTAARATNAPNPTVTPPPIPSPTLQWFEGGTLHNATVAEWRVAERRNQVATSADWAAVGFDLHTLADIRFYSEQLLDCIDESFDTYAEAYSKSAPIVDAATVCVAMIKP